MSTSIDAKVQADNHAQVRKTIESRVRQLTLMLSYAWELERPFPVKGLLYSEAAAFSLELAKVYKTKPTGKTLSLNNLKCEVKAQNGTVLGQSKILYKNKDNLLVRGEVSFNATIGAKLSKFRLFYTAMQATQSHIGIRSINMVTEIEGSREDSPFYDDESKKSPSELIKWGVDSRFIEPKFFGTSFTLKNDYDFSLENFEEFNSIDPYGYFSTNSLGLLLLSPEANAAGAKFKATGKEIVGPTVFGISNSKVNPYTGIYERELTQELQISCSAN
jgi:hypothetical protein